MGREFILNIHGYKGTDKNSMYKALTKCGYEAVSPALNYDRADPLQIMQELKEVISGQENAGNILQGVSGTSLGGFYAFCISAEYKIPAVLVNPALFPELVLPKLGCRCSMKDFLKLRACLADYDPQLITCIIGEKDDVISNPIMRGYSDEIFCGKRVVHVPDGKHSGSTLPLSAIFRSRDVF